MFNPIVDPYFGAHFHAFSIAYFARCHDFGWPCATSRGVVTESDGAFLRSYESMAPVEEDSGGAYFLLGGVRPLGGRRYFNIGGCWLKRQV